MFLLFFLASAVLLPLTFSQLSAYGNWTPEYIRYCDVVQSTDTTKPLYGGVTCGAGSWNSMSAFFDVKISSTVTLGLINVAWITTEALQTQAGFWKTCKPYMVRIFDGLWSDITKACTLIVNPPSGITNCTQNYTESFLYRSGSGYCMKAKVCGATEEIDFLRGPDNSSILYSWSTDHSTTLTNLGYTKFGNCYGYEKLANPLSTDDNIRLERFY